MCARRREGKSGGLQGAWQPRTLLVHQDFASKPSIVGVELVMRPAELAVGGDPAVLGGHVGDVLGRVDRQRLNHLLGPAGAAEIHRLRIEHPRPFFVEQPQQQLVGRDMRADQLFWLGGVQVQVHPAPVLGVIAVQEILGRQQPALARAAALRMRARLWHVLDHHPARAPQRPVLAGRKALAHRQREARRQLFGLREIGLGAGRERAARERRDALVGRGARPLVDQQREHALAQPLEGRPVMQRQPLFVEAGPGADAAGLALGGRSIIVGGDDAHRPVAADLQRQLPAQLDGLADQRGQQRRLGHQRRDRRRIGVLGQDFLERPVQPRDPAANVGMVQLEGQDCIVPGDLLCCGHGSIRLFFAGRRAVRLPSGAPLHRHSRRACQGDPPAQSLAPRSSRSRSPAADSRVWACVCSFMRSQVRYICAMRGLPASRSRLRTRKSQ